MNTSDRLRLVYFGSGAFGLPTLRRLVSRHDVALIVTQPDRPAGRRRVLTPTPVGEFARDADLEIIRPENPNDPEVIQRVRNVHADAFVVIAYGHKLSAALIGETFAINLHASLLPRYRGAAPIQWAMINNEKEAGLSVITLAQRMDAGAILAQSRTPIDPRETASELEERLAKLGPAAIERVLEDFRAGTLKPIEQDESQASRAPKLSKADGTLPQGFDQPAELVRARIHGLTPWPGCTVRIDDRTVKIIRVEEVEPHDEDAPAGTMFPDGVVQCSPGAVQVLELQPPGGRVMRFDEYIRGHALPDQVRCVPA